MSVPFLRQVAGYILQAHKDTTDSLCLVLPNKRAGLFLRAHLSELAGKTIWMPRIMGAEEFFTELSDLKQAAEIDLLCHLYESYRACCGEKAENFGNFSKWGHLILQDFNEIDRYLADHRQLYENLHNIKTIENWSLGETELTGTQKDYLEFMASLARIYDHFNSALQNKGQAYQGMVYRRALEKVTQSNFTDSYSCVLFCGFNAMNKAEERIVDHLYHTKRAAMLWDSDAYYLEQDIQEAGLFLRKYMVQWPDVRKSHPELNFRDEKSIRIISVPGQHGQAQVVNQELQELLNMGISPDRIALVLANEKLLWPVLQQIPSDIRQVNITMEYPLRYTPAYSFFESILQIQLAYQAQGKSRKIIYHRDFTRLLREPLFQTYLDARGLNLRCEEILKYIRERNISFVQHSTLSELLGDSISILSFIFLPVNGITAFNEKLRQMILVLSEHLLKSTPNLSLQFELEYLHILLRHFNRLEELLLTYPYFSDFESYQDLFHELLGQASAPFSGEPLQGLQIMGILESRVLDFEHVILVNANEGVLPSGKTMNSFIPNDLKRAFGLPLYHEKDAVYAYHFYRLLQRSQNILITYDSFSDTFGKGEKSRFITQLQLEMPAYNKAIRISEQVAGYNRLPGNQTSEIRVQKNPGIMKEILDRSQSREEYKGLSPSSLISFKECGLKFYLRYGAGLKPTEEVEENAEQNTMGSILHLSLENLYLDLLNRPLRESDFNKKLNLIENTVHHAFISSFNQQMPFGKSLLQEEVIKAYVRKQVKQDIQDARSLSASRGVFSLLYLEQEFSSALLLSGENKAATELILKGKADRVDRFGDCIRIIDYKSSVKPSDKFGFDGFEPLFSDKAYNKQLQLILYAWLCYKNDVASPDLLRPCIVAFKNYRPEPYFLKKDKADLIMDEAFFVSFEKALTEFAGRLFDTGQDFEQTQDQDSCLYCDYSPICMR
ncbi:MAG TPA: PD-(D/E)XK nuclease family protein [Bacteroidia bacterium]|nr:PD-(D/E)XK nuclease family protein [Bacteroidia bacterium]